MIVHRILIDLSFSSGVRRTACIRNKSSLNGVRAQAWTGGPIRLERPRNGGCRGDWGCPGPPAGPGSRGPKPVSDPTGMWRVCRRQLDLCLSEPIRPYIRLGAALDSMPRCFTIARVRTQRAGVGTSTKSCLRPTSSAGRFLSRDSYAELPAFMVKVRAMDGIGARRRRIHHPHGGAHRGHARVSVV